MWSFLGDTPVILASASPRRKAILQNAGLKFTIRPVEVGEDILPGELPFSIAMNNAQNKADAAADFEANEWIIAADTVVALGKRIIGKPKNAKDAFRILTALSGETHTVYTGFAILNSYSLGSYYDFDTAEVTFYKLSPQEIETYIATGEPLDKAGAYGIQAQGGLLVKSIQGDHFNVAGLPVAKLRCDWISNYKELIRVRHR